MNSRASTRTRLSVLPVLIALLLNVLLPISRAGIGLVSAADGIDDYSQCQIGNPSSGLDCESWINGILNATHNNYNEDEVVPQRLVVDFDDTDNHTVTLSYMTRKDSGTQNHAYDYLATWNHSYINADRCQSLGNPALCVGGLPSLFPIPSDPNSVTPGGPQPTSAHELPQANRQFVMYGGTITGTSAITHSTDPSEAGSDYGNITISFDVTDSNGRVMLLFGGHLAAGFGPRGWGAGLGAASISGGPYHIRVTGIDGASAGNRDNQIMSNAISPVPGLAIAKTTSTPVISAGEVASYTVTVTNSGQGEATGVVITDNLPSGVTWTDNSASCTIANGFQLSCGPLTIPASSSFSVTVTGTTDAGECPSISNTASYTSTNGGSGDTTANPTVITVNCPTIRVAKTPDEDAQNPGANDVNVGSPATFTVTVHNDGAGTASGVTVFDDLPGTGWSVVAADTTLAGCAVTDPSTGEHADKGEILTCGPDTIGAGLSKKVTVTRTTTTADCGELNNTASAASSNDGTDTDAGNIDVLCPQIRVEKTPDEIEGNPGANDVSAGDAASFTITVFNDGAAPATNVNLFDDLPGTGWSVVAGATLTGCAVSDPSSGEHADKGEILTCGPDTVGAGASKSVTVTKTTAPADCGSIDNTVSVTIGNGAGDSDGGNIDVLCPTITVEKTPDDGTVDAPGTATFTILTTNGGLGVAADAELFDDLPEVSGSWTLGSVPIGETGWDSCTVFDTDHPTLGDIGEWLSCGPEDIEAGGDRTVVVTTSVTTEDCGRLPNAAEIEISNGEGDTDSGLIRVQCPDLDITKSADDPTVNAGDDIGFSITVSNSNAAGTGVADNVTLNDPLPGSLALGIDWSIDAVLFNDALVVDQDLCTISGSPATETLVCDFGDLNPSDDYEVQLSSGTSAPNGCTNASLPNEATADADNHAAITANASITVQCPDLDITKSADDDTVNAGDAIGFDINVGNGDAAGTGTAINVTLDDPLPGSLALGIDWEIDAVLFNDTPVVDQTLCQITGSPPSETLECDFGDLAPGDDYEVQLSSDTSAPNGCQTATLPNEATADADNHAAIEANASVTVECPNLEIEKTTTTPEINAGEEASYTITITNDGDGAAINVDLVDTLPSGITWSEDSEDCEINAGVLECLDLTIAAEAGSFSVTLTGIADEDECPSILNRATFTSDNAGSGASAPEGEGTLITVNCPDLQVDKEWVDANGDPTDDPVTAGTKAFFAITVTNLGPGTATNVVVFDEAPDGTVWTVVDDGGFDCPSMIDDAGDSCTDEAFAPGSATILLSYLTGPEDCGTLTNEVEVSASNEPGRLVDLKNADSATAIVECPFLNITKVADEDPIDAGEEASFTITIWNSGDGDALDVEFHDDLPPGIEWNLEVLSAHKFECEFASSQVEGGEFQQSIDCALGDLAPGDMEDGVVIRVFADTDRTDCGTLLNLATVDARNLSQQLELLGVQEPGEPLGDSDTITVFCPIIALEKENDAVGSVLPGTEVTYTLTLTVDDETESVTDSVAEDVVVIDVMPVGLENPTDFRIDGVPFAADFDAGTRTITWNLGDLPHGDYDLTYNATVADDVEHGDELVNAAAATSPNSQCPATNPLPEECRDDSTVIPRVPTLVIDKVANVEVITITGPANAPIATPSVVTWTLTYTLTNGPVTNAVITDEVPEGFEFLDASDGGALVDGVVTWTFLTLSESGSVSFRTTVDPETISRVAPTVNVAVIDSDETAPDDGQDSVTVRVVPPPAGGNPTPGASLPDTAAGISPTGEPVNVPVELLAYVFIGSLGALTLANVRARSRRR